MSDTSKLNNSIISEFYTDLILEALDFKNIIPYDVDSNMTFQSSVGLVEIKIEALDDLSIEFLSLPTIVKQTRDFYERKNKDINIYNLGYNVNGIDTQYVKSDFKELIRILYTVVLEAKKFIEKNQPFGLFIFSRSKNTSIGLQIDDQKKMIYDKIVNTNLPTGYTSANVKFVNKPAKLVYKKTLPNKK